MLKATGIVRRIDDLGRIVLPKELRTTYGIEDDDPLEIYTDETGIVLRPYRTRCPICGAELDDQAVAVSDKHICKACAEKLRHD